MKKLLCILLALMMAFTLGCCGKESTGEESAVKAQKDDFSYFRTETLEGERVSEKIFEGKITMLNIWGTFCGPCIGEMPDLQRLHEDYADKGLQVVGVIDDIYRVGVGYDQRDIEEAKSIVGLTGVKYRNLLPSEDLEIIRLDDVSSVPETLFIDEKGKIIAGPFVGARNYESWASVIDSVLMYAEGTEAVTE